MTTKGYSRYAPEMTVAVRGRDWLLCRPANLEELWEAMTHEDFGDDERLPYWVELWPASIALAEWMQERPEAIRGKRCLDLGCGLGLTAMVGSSLGGQVIGMDYEEEALRYAHLNAERNGVSQPFWTVMDWRAPAIAPGSIDLVWGGDIMYERRFVRPVFDFLGYALAPGGKAWMAEPNRDVYQHFKAALVQDGWVAKSVYTGKLDAIYAQPERVGVTLWEVSRCP